jgi:hypothetical protein
LAQTVDALGSSGGIVPLGNQTYIASTLVIPRGVIIQGENIYIRTNGSLGQITVDGGPLEINAGLRLNPDKLL